jgi:REP element-mobilizing transposase RayT
MVPEVHLKADLPEVNHDFAESKILWVLEENRELCEKILREVAERHGIKIVEISVMPDHVHLIAGICAY